MEITGSSESDSLFLRDPTEQVSPSPHLRMETDPVSEPLCFLIFRILEKIQKPSNYELPLGVISLQLYPPQSCCYIIQVIQSITYFQNK
jgi:hypothetical protein